MSVRIELTSGKMVEINWIPQALRDALLPLSMKREASFTKHDCWQTRLHDRMEELELHKFDLLFLILNMSIQSSLLLTTPRNIHVQLRGAIGKHLHLKSAHTGVFIHVALVTSPQGCVGTFKQGSHLPNWPIYYIIVVVRGWDFWIKISDLQGTNCKQKKQKNTTKKWLTVTDWWDSQALSACTHVFLKTLLSLWPFIQT